MNRQVSMYRWLLRLYSAGFRREFGDEMARLFAEQLADARAGDDTLAVARLWVSTLIDLGLTAPGERIRRDEPVARIVTVGSDFGGTEPRRPASMPRLLLGLLPMWVFLFFSLAAPGYLDPLYLNPPGILGVPAGMALVVLALVWMLVGLLGLYRLTSDALALLVLMLFTVPATFAIVLAPAMIMIIVNLVIQNPT